MVLKASFRRRTHVDLKIRHTSAKFNQKYLRTHIFAPTDLWLNSHYLAVFPDLEVNFYVNIIPTLVSDAYVVINKENTVELIRNLKPPI